MSGCIFCRIGQKEIPAQFVHEDASVFALRDLNPQAPIHFLIIPRKHLPRVMSVGAEDASLFADVHRAAQILAEKNGVHESGFRLVVNNGPDAGQTVDHLHFHLLAGRKLGWPPG